MVDPPESAPAGDSGDGPGHHRDPGCGVDPEAAADSLTALNSASGYLQREIGKTLKSRITPRLSFVYDDTDIRGRQLSDLIDSALASDRNKAGD